MPRKSRIDTWLQTFAAWDEEEQEDALKMAGMVMRIAPAIRKSSLNPKPQPAQSDGVEDLKNAPGAVQGDLPGRFRDQP